MTDSPAPTHRGWLVPTLLVALIVAVLAVAGVLLFTRSSGSASPAASKSARVVNNIAAPDDSCTSSPDRAFEDQWQVNGWWAGYVNGESKQMQAGKALQLQIAGAQVSRVWLCPPKSQW